MIEIVKNIATVVGCVISSITLISIIFKPLRTAITSFVKDKAGKPETDRQLAEIHNMLQHHIEDDKAFKNRMEESMAITFDFTEKQCRKEIKNIYYKYRDTKKLPIWEKKSLMDIEDLYINRMQKNHWGQTLINEMKKWDIDCSGEEIDILE